VSGSEFFSLQKYKKKVERVFENPNKLNKVKFIVKKIAFDLQIRKKNCIFAAGKSFW